MSEEKIVEGPEAAAEGADDKAYDDAWDTIAKEKAGQVNDPPVEPSEEKPETVKPHEEAPADAPTAPAKTADDLWKDAPPELREAHERALAAERTRAEAAETTVKRHSGRLSIADRELNELRAKLTPQEGGTATPPGEEATDREERRKQLLDEYGDSVGKLIPDIIALEEKMRRLEGAHTAQAEAQTEERLDQQATILIEAHPTYAQDVQDQRFVNWALAQPEYVQAAIRQNAKQIVDGSSAADLLTRYKRDTGQIKDEARERHQERREEQLDASRGADTRNPSAGKGKADSYDAAWDELAAESRRKAAGRK